MTATRRTIPPAPLAGLLILATLVQLLFILETNHRPAFDIPVVDAASYHRQALTLADGGTSEPRPFWQPPLYVYWLSLVYRSVSRDILVVRLLQGGFGVAAVLLTFLAARLAGVTTRPAFAGAAAVACYGPLLFFTTQLLPTGMAVALNTGVLCCWLLLARKPSWTVGLLTGMLTGLAALTVSNILVVVPFMLGWIGWQARRTSVRTGWLRTAAALVGGLLLSVAPVTIRNYTVSGQFVPISTNAGINLYIGNNADTDRTITIRPGIDWTRLTAQPYRNGARNDVEAQRFFFRRVSEFAKDKPLAFAQSTVLKTVQLTNSREIPRNVDLYAFRPYSRVLSLLVWRIGSLCFPFGILAPLVLAGMLTVVRGNAAQRMIAVYAMVYSCSVILFFPSSRYAAPVVPALIVMAVGGVNHLRCRQRFVVTATVTALLLCNLPVRFPTDTIDYRAELQMFLGVGLQTRGRSEAAEDHYLAALQLNPDLVDAHRYLGTLYRDTGRSKLAETSLRRALELRPDHDKALQDLAVITYQNGEVKEAVAMLSRALELDPDNHNAMINLAVGLLDLGRKEEANQWLHRAGVLNSHGVNMDKLQRFRR